MSEILILFMSIKGRINFLQLERYSENCEQYYRNHFEKEFDFMDFNIKLVQEYCSNHIAIAFDPSYVNKSGKHTPGAGYFWSGCAGKVKWGLEVGGVGAVDIENHTCMHIEAVQTPAKLDSNNLLEHYAELLDKRKEQLQQVSQYLIVDAFFSKYSFVAKMMEAKYEVISRLRDDADLRYLYRGEQRKGRGRKKQYDGKIYYQELREEYFDLIKDEETTKTYHAIVNSVSLKMNINLVIVFTKKKKGWSHKLYFATDLELTPQAILQYYHARFQIEFIYRDSKQFTGMNDCQARSKNKLHFHINAALSAVNIAKVSHWLSIPEEQRKQFSMADVKTQYYNQLMLDRFISKFGIDPNTRKNKEKIRQLLKTGCIAA